MCCVYELYLWRKVTTSTIREAKICEDAMECYSATERNELLIHNNLDEFQRNHVMKKANPKSLHAT